jgi:hypothetical protein
MQNKPAIMTGMQARLGVVTREGHHQKPRPNRESVQLRAALATAF